MNFNPYLAFHKELIPWSIDLNAKSKTIKSLEKTWEKNFLALSYANTLHF